MLNSLNLVGIVSEPLVIRETTSGIQFGHFIIDVERSFKKQDATKESDKFSITVWRNLIESAMELKRGDIVSLQGRLIDNNFVKDDGTISYKVDLIAEKLDRLN